jgi:hypothetical protein
MLSMTYFLLSGQTRDVIVHGETGFKINVYRLEKEIFVPKDGELHVFGKDNKEWLAFETSGWNTEKLEIISAAVLWYSEYIGFYELQLTFTDPRQMHKLTAC